MEEPTCITVYDSREYILCRENTLYIYKEHILCGCMGVSGGAIMHHTIIIINIIINHASRCPASDPRACVRVVCVSVCLSVCVAHVRGGATRQNKMPCQHTSHTHPPPPHRQNKYLLTGKTRCPAHIPHTRTHNTLPLEFTTRTLLHLTPMHTPLLHLTPMHFTTYDTHFTTYDTHFTTLYYI